MFDLSRRQLTRSGLVAALGGGVLTACESGVSSDKSQARAAADMLTPEQLAFSSGQPDAAVIMQEFLSLTCPHCAAFHRQGYPLLKQSYIDDGQLLLVYRHFPLDGMALRAHMLVASLPPTIGLKLQDVLLSRQSAWINREGNLEPLSNMAQLAGISPDQIAAVFADEALMDSMIAERQAATVDYGISGTPGFVIGSEQFSGGSYEEIADWVGSYIV
jgi:protein-disulfide isomerase